MIIILGMDNTGKTTLANELSEGLKARIIKSPGPALSAQEQKDWVIDQICGADERKAIHERFALFEEIIYGNLLRDKSNFSIGDSYYELLKKAEPLIIYCRPSVDRILDFGDRFQMEGVVDKSKELLAAYDELIFRLASEKWKINIYNFEINYIDADEDGVITFY